MTSVLAETAANKAALRRHLLSYRQQMEGVDRQKATVTLLQGLQSRARDEAWQRVAVYLPWRDEPDLRPLWRHWQRTGLCLALPVVVEAQAPLVMRAWAEDAVMAKDAMGLPVPAAGAVLDCDTWVIPCVGIGPGGERLGAGMGFYDRSIAAVLGAEGQPPPVRPRFVGLCFSHGLIAQPFGEPHDARLDACLTERGWSDF